MIDFEKLNANRKALQQKASTVKYYRVPPGTAANVVKINGGGEWVSKVRKDYITKTQTDFLLEEVYVDPLQSYYPDPVAKAGRRRRDYARDGWYGFKRDGLVLFVPASRVELV